MRKFHIIWFLKEHGIGLGKKKYMIEQFGKETCDLMIEIKTLLDPNNILNPNKIF
jgi:D-lactate dehydrogenase (cytochrome)